MTNAMKNTVFIQIEAPSQLDAPPWFLTWCTFKILGMILKIKAVNLLKWSKFAFCSSKTH